MSLPVTVTFGTAPDGTCPTTFNDLIVQLNALVSATTTGSYVPYVVGAVTPSVDDQNKAWIRLDNAGRPLGTFLFYAGSWRRQYNGKFNEITMFNGNPSLFFDSNGLGLTTSEWDGWHLCNGKDGVINLTDKFIVASHMDDSDGSVGYSSVWRSKVSGSILATGGVKDITLTEDNTYQTPHDQILLDKFTADGNARSNSGALLGHYSGTHDPDGSEAINAGFDGNTSPDPIPTLPPYYALAFAVFIGYA